MVETIWNFTPMDTFSHGSHRQKPSYKLYTLHCKKPSQRFDTGRKFRTDFLLAAVLFDNSTLERATALNFYQNNNFGAFSTFFGIRK
jgi:hypothetical protein